jgi:hypothetical protein
LGLAHAIGDDARGHAALDERQQARGADGGQCFAGRRAGRRRCRDTGRPDRRQWIQGGQIAGNAAIQGGQIAGDAAIQGGQIAAGAIREGNQAIIAGNQQGQKTLQQLRADAAPSVGYLRNVMAHPGGLTPEQQAQLDDLHRSTTNTLHSTSFAGSGRAGASLLRKTENDFRNRSLATNVSRADEAARAMYGTGTGAATGIAASQAATGAQVAQGATAIGKVSGDAAAAAGQYTGNAAAAAGQYGGAAAAAAGKYGADAITAAGKSYGDATTKAGLYDAQAGIANGNLMGRAIGDIGSQIANEGRESRYADRLTAIENSLRTNKSSNSNWLQG